MENENQWNNQLNKKNVKILQRLNTAARLKHHITSLTKLLFGFQIRVLSHERQYIAYIHGLQL